MLRKTILYLDFIQVSGSSKCILEGYLGGKKASLDDIRLLANGKEFSIKRVKRDLNHDGIDLHMPIEKSAFIAELDMPSMPLKISAQGKTGEIRIVGNRFTGLSGLLFSYSERDGYLLSLFHGNISIHTRSKLRLLAYELTTLVVIALDWQIPKALKKFSIAQGMKAKIRRAFLSIFIIGESIITIPYSLFLRVSHGLARLKTAKNPIWLVSDRASAAGDNGEVLFDYINTLPEVHERVYFVLHKKSADYQRVSDIGEVIHHGSLRHLLLFLSAEKIISSHADTEVTNPFSRQLDRFVGLFNHEFIFLQHGVIRHDHSTWLNRYNKNIKLFVTSSDIEKKSIINKPYHYLTEQIALTGLPRFDRLASAPKNKLIVAPTFRNFLIKNRLNKNGERSYDNSFKASEYYNFYNRFINDQRIGSALKKAGMKGELYLHPVFKAQIHDFTDNSDFQVMGYPYDYNKAFREGNMLVSDYSSVVFDFAYLKKPILYAQFDKEKFYKGHTFPKSDFFEDDKHGFGIICSSYEELVSETINTILQSCEMPKKYKTRVESYFRYNDTNNSKRVYAAIQGLNKEKQT